ncbi:barstar family protein [Rhodococcus spelaei]|uniref:Barstar family protein n=1 Tax=Rhodococcus spelaei TaxID=2546320 RepID=A0A541B0Y7_9NOCA|nr:barstar family protein [Rhodococcus spelaei]TQF65979.1 barstar family protein [Rhodococcus spelaei]
MVTLTEFVTDPTLPPAGVLPDITRSADNAALALTRAGWTVRLVRGPKMATVAAVFDEFAAALQFPYYFGANKDAFDECLRDCPDWLGDSRGLVVVVRDADALLASAPAELAWFADALDDADVRLILQAEPGAAADLARRWPGTRGGPAHLEA